MFENSLMTHHISVPPGTMGKVTYVAPAGQYSIKVGFFVCCMFSLDLFRCVLNSFLIYVHNVIEIVFLNMFIILHVFFRTQYWNLSSKE